MHKLRRLRILFLGYDSACVVSEHLITMMLCGIFSLFSVVVLAKAVQIGKGVRGPSFEQRSASRERNPHPADDARPHILLITTDQQRLDSISAYADDRSQKKSGIASPNLDKLASEGVRFTDAFAASPVCSPCRTSLLTGVHVPVHGVVENTIKPHKPGLTVFPDVLQGLGYTCFVIGKTHYDPVPESFVFKDVHNGNTDMRCDNTSYFDGSCGYYNETDFLETYLVDKFITKITVFLSSERYTTKKKSGSHNDAAPPSNSSSATTTSRFFVHLSFVSPHPPSTPPVEPFAWNKRYTPEDLPPINSEVKRLLRAYWMH